MSLKIVNVMWSGGSPFMSIHKVHRDVLAHAPVGTQVDNWLLLDGELCAGAGQSRTWQLSARVLKGRRFSALLRPWVRRRLYRALQDAAPDLVLMDGLGVARLLLPVLRRLPGVRAAVLFHGSTRIAPGDVKLFGRFSPERLSVAAVSATLARSLAEDLGRPVATLRVALDPFAYAQQLLSAQQARQALALPSQAQGPVFGAVGRLVESKGFEMLLEAFAQAAVQVPGMQLAVLGDGPLRAGLEARAKALGIEASVHFCGHREDLASLYPAFDWLLVPSRAEGLGLVLQEAVLAKVPVICSDLPVFREQLAQAGCYLPVGDRAAWAQAIARCAAVEPGSQAATQWRALAPVEAWGAFAAGSLKLLGG
ncbi:MAG: glycosyltransferase [Paucimonas sp.]|jgi:glycosyltransferase involved in cell wall biosynthesis|nr:glycosyltransferase [Paucimonas sp.]